MASKQENLDKITGKWVYIWRLKNMFGGNLERVFGELRKANVHGVAIKVHNGYDKWDEEDEYKLDEFMRMAKANGIEVMLWGYIYLKYDALAEANAAVAMVNKWPDQICAYLIDAESQAKHQWAPAKVFANRLKAGVPDNVPIGLNSYRFPHLHQELPWKALRGVSDFDAPQVYYRWGDPSDNLYGSKAEFDAMLPPLPFIPAGDMYYEHGFSPSISQLEEFLVTCKADDDIPAVIMWVMDQLERLPDLWQAFAEFDWPFDGQEDNEIPHVDAVSALGNFLDETLDELQDNSAKYQEILDNSLRSGQLPDVMPRLPHEAALVAGIRKVYKDVRPGDIPPPVEQPLFSGVTTAYRLNERTGPGLSFAKIGYQNKGQRVDVYEVATGPLYNWGRLSPGGESPQRWVATKWVSRF